LQHKFCSKFISGTVTDNNLSHFGANIKVVGAAGTVTDSEGKLLKHQSNHLM
jgi:hypothetical protein